MICGYKRSSARDQAAQEIKPSAKTEGGKIRTDAEKGDVGTLKSD
jgi:hypothetical protein